MVTACCQWKRYFFSKGSPMLNTNECSILNFSKIFLLEDGQTIKLLCSFPLYKRKEQSVVPHIFVIKHYFDAMDTAHKWMKSISVFTKPPDIDSLLEKYQICRFKQILVLRALINLVFFIIVFIMNQHILNITFIIVISFQFVSIYQSCYITIELKNETKREKLFHVKNRTVVKHEFYRTFL